MHILQRKFCVLINFSLKFGAIHAVTPAPKPSGQHRANFCRDWRQRSLSPWQPRCGQWRQRRHHDNMWGLSRILWTYPVHLFELRHWNWLETRFFVTLSGTETGIIRPIPRLLMPWLLASPGHQQPWCWLCRIHMPLTSTRKDLNHRVSVENG